jgi:hypothetical protein
VTRIFELFMGHFLRGLDYSGRAKASLRAEKGGGRGRRRCAAGGGHVPLPG